MDAESLLERLGAQLRTRRLQQGLTQAEVAARAGLPRLKVLHVEAGRPTVSALAYARVAAALGLDLGTVAARRPTLEDMKGFLDE
ncbi:helix-turn-helix domain-containing protein [Caldimonas sp. KR1-144]|uniref:helix-turn-helix domain-containing protein n=1 Tax=Caldimonas sp. KR1-144 TaxID=3400911 RepID=UPI003C0FC369